MESLLSQLLSVEQVARWLGRPTAAIEKMAKTGQLPHVELPTGDIIFVAAELAAWVQSLPRKEVAHAKR